MFYPISLTDGTCTHQMVKISKYILKQLKIVNVKNNSAMHDNRHKQISICNLSDANVQEVVIEIAK